MLRHRLLYVFVLTIAGTLCFPQELLIYDGRPLEELGIKAGGWGSGSIGQVKERVFRGSFSLKLTSLNYYEGGRLEFSRPIDLSPFLNNPYAFLQFRVSLGTYALPTFPGAFGGPGAPGAFGGMPGAGGPGFGGMPGMGGAPGMFAPTGQVLPLRGLRIVLFCEDGLLVSEGFPLSFQIRMGEAWFVVAIPFNTFKGKGNGKVTQMLICTNSPQIVYIGEIKATIDRTPIKLNLPYTALSARVNIPVQFFASAEGGLSTLRFSWDFDKSDGIQEEAIGNPVVHTFTKEGKYIVTVTVSDEAGVKKPVQGEISVEVYR